ncbi:MAG: HAMP domain-containing sensor histidine kinase, partial [Longimicrobiales bacterium]
NWVAERSRVLSLAESVLSDDPPEVRETSIRLTAADGRVLVGPPAAEPRLGGEVQVSFAVRAGSEARASTVRADLPIDVLLPDAWLSGLGGAAVAVFPRGGTTPLVPVSIDPARFRETRFEWGGDTWVVERRALRSPPLDLALASPLSPVMGPFREAARQGRWLVLLTTVLVAGTMLVLTRRMTRSLAELADAADAVAAGDLAPRLPESGDEIGRVADAFRTMATNLRTTLTRLTQQETLAELGTFAGTLSHEIRNPLTAARLDLQRARRRTVDPDQAALLDRALRQVDRLIAAVATLNQVARSGRARAEPIALRPIVLKAVDGAAAAAAAAGARLVVEAESVHAPVLGDPAALEHLLENLLRNAVEAVGGGGTVQISILMLTEPEEGAAVEVVVEDDGPGVPAHLRGRVFEPGFSTRPSGTGLGLPLARRIARAHGGDLTLGDGVDGGLRAVVRLPLRSVKDPDAAV